MEHQVTGQAYIRKLTLAQQDMVDDISIAIVQGIGTGRGYSYKISRADGEAIQNRSANGLPTLAVVRFRNTFHLRPIVQVVVKPTPQLLAYAMRWVTQLLHDQRYEELQQLETDLIHGN